MRTKNKVCPFCNETFSAYNHLQLCKPVDYQYDPVAAYFNLKLRTDCKVIADEYNNGMSLPELSVKYSISIVEVIRVLKVFNVNTRTIKQSNTSEVVRKRKDTSFKRFGVSNPSQSEIVKDLKKQTFLKNYGVDNIFKFSGFSEMVSRILLEKYGKKRLTNSEAIKIARKKFNREKWSEIDDKRKQTCINRYGVDDPSKMPHRRVSAGEIFKKWWESASDEELSKVYGNNTNLISSCEKQIWGILSDNGIMFQTQRFINRKSYDIYIHGTGIIVEVQGDYWHGNPKIYKDSDLISYPKGVKMLAEDVWNRDLLKKQNAEGYGFKVIYLWESDINFHKQNKTLDWFVLNTLYEAGKD